MKNISFSGDIIPAICNCHRGQFVARAFFVDPKKGEIEIAHTFFQSMSEAEKHLDGFVVSMADEHLKTIGLSVDSAKTMTVVRGDDALQAVRKTINESNPNLH